jgi:hypothetical protein
MQLRMMIVANGSEGSALDTPIVVPEPIRVIGVADACRAAAFTFVDEAEGWGKLELARWLAAPYANLLRHTASLEPAEVSGVMQITRIGTLDEQVVQRVVWRAHVEVMETLQNIKITSEAQTFTLAMISLGKVARFRDATGALGWLPTPRARRLAERVLSLVAGDYLVRPADYASDPISGIVARPGNDVEPDRENRNVLRLASAATGKARVREGA